MTDRSSAEILTAPPPSDADRRLAYGSEPLQFGDLRLPPGSGLHPLVVFLHGGYWQAIYNLTHTGHLCVDLAAHGIATWNVEYRRVGDPGGGWPGTFEDALNGLAYVRELANGHTPDLDRVIVVGHSAGGQLAIWGAMRSELPVRAAVSLAGVVDMHSTHHTGDDHGLIRRLLGGGPDEVPERWRAASLRQQLPFGVRTVLVCGTKDAHWSQNQETAVAARDAGDEIELIALPSAGHFDLVNPSAPEWSVVRTKIEELLQ